MKLLALSVLMAILLGFTSDAAVASIVLAFNGAGTELRDMEDIPLERGAKLGAYDGDIYQIGYYTQATVSDPFSGIWTVLKVSTIGDKGDGNLGAGEFHFRGFLNDASILEGTPLSIRFYDAVSLDEATYFNTVSDMTGAWNWVAGKGLSGDPPLTLSLADSTLVWQDGPGSAFRTTMAVPEPGSSLLTAAGIMVLLARRNRVVRPA